MVVSEFKSKIVSIYTSCFMYLTVFKNKLSIQVNMQKGKEEQCGEIGLLSKALWVKPWKQSTLIKILNPEGYWGLKVIQTDDRLV